MSAQVPGQRKVETMEAEKSERQPLTEEDIKAHLGEYPEQLTYWLEVVANTSPSSTPSRST